MLSKKDILDKFIESLKDAPAQGTEEWRKRRQRTIGGSEAYNLFTPSGIRQLLRSKAGRDPFRGNLYTRWGNLFEPILRNYVAKQLECDIYETGAAPGMADENGRVVQTYSPDGLGVVNADNLRRFLRTFTQRSDTAIDAIIGNEREFTILFEYKNPFKRVPKFDWAGYTKNYHTQVLTGLETIKICDLGLYIDGVFRLSLEGRQIELESQGMYDASKVLTRGVIGIYCSHQVEVNDNFNYTSTEIEVLLEKIFTDWHDDRFEVEYFQTVDEFLEHCERMNVTPIANLPYELLDLYCIPVVPQRGFLSDKFALIKAIIDGADELRKVHEEQYYDAEQAIYERIVSSLKGAI